VHVDKVAFTLLEGGPRSLDQGAEVVLALTDATNFNDLDGDGQLGRPQNLIDRVVNVVNQASHQNREHVVVTNGIRVRGCSIVHLSHVAHKLHDRLVVDWACDLDGAQSPLIAIEELVLALDVGVEEVASHGANVHSGTRPLLCPRANSVRQHEFRILAERLADGHHRADIVVSHAGFARVEAPRQSVLILNNISDREVHGQDRHNV